MASKRFYPSPVSVRCTAEELEQLKALAEAYGVTLSALFRDAVLAERQAPRKRKTRQPVKNKKALAKMAAMLGQSRMASNLNQLARAVNSGSLAMTPRTEAELKGACRDIRIMRHLMMRALGVIADEDEDAEDDDEGGEDSGDSP
ncbi:MAG: ribbon-helix-helix protein, CopG family [Sphingomonadales bacterium]|nr:MAG: ribbon-helix-helix protein, CopG family [Sphingomonadales bacterium]